MGIPPRGVLRVIDMAEDKNISEQPVTRLILCDDHEAVRRGIHWTLHDSEHFEIVGEAANGDEVLPLCEAEKPDIVVLDIRLPGMAADKILFELKRRWPHGMRVMVYSASDHRQSVLEFLRLGAEAFVVKTASMETFLQALEALRQGRIFYDPAVREFYREHLKFNVQHSDSLSEREREVLARIAQGYLTKEIAADLAIATSTVEWHSERIKKKTKTRNIAEMTLCALEIGII